MSRAGLDGSTAAVAAASAHAAQSEEVVAFFDLHLSHVHGEFTFVGAVDAVRSALDGFDYLLPDNTLLSLIIVPAFRLLPEALSVDGAAMLTIGIADETARGFEIVISFGDGVGDTIADDFVFTSLTSASLFIHG